MYKGLQDKTYCSSNIWKWYLTKTYDCNQRLMLFSIFFSLFVTSVCPDSSYQASIPPTLHPLSSSSPHPPPPPDPPKRPASHSLASRPPFPPRPVPHPPLGRHHRGSWRMRACTGGRRLRTPASCMGRLLLEGCQEVGKWFKALSVLVWPGGLDLPARSLTGGYLIKSALN